MVVVVATEVSVLRETAVKVLSGAVTETTMDLSGPGTVSVETRSMPDTVTVEGRAETVTRTVVVIVLPGAVMVVAENR